MLIRQQYDRMIQYTPALRLGTADTVAILRRFTRNNVQHPTYQAFAELGKAMKTIFLCRYLHPPDLRREIHEGLLNMVEQWHGATDFVFFVRRGELASNRHEDREISMLALHRGEGVKGTGLDSGMPAKPQGKNLLAIVLEEGLKVLCTMQHAHHLDAVAPDTVKHEVIAGNQEAEAGRDVQSRGAQERILGQAHHPGVQGIEDAVGGAGIVVGDIRPDRHQILTRLLG